MASFGARAFGDRPLRTTTCWNPRESSLRHESFNAIVEKRRLDSTEVLVKNGCMGKQALMGPKWMPSAVMSRRTADLLQTRLRGSSTPRAGGGRAGVSALAAEAMMEATAPPLSARTSTPGESGAARASFADATQEAGSRRAAWAAGPARAATGAGRGQTPEAGPMATPAPVEALRSPHAFFPRENALSRESYNSIVNQKRLDFDPSVCLVKESTMGKRALMGSDWTPGALHTRQIAGGQG